MSDTGPSWNERLAGIWGRAESTVTKVLLAVVFTLGLVAQFVKPVGDALQDKVYLGGALLAAVGYVLYSEVQHLNAALTTQQETEQSMTDAVRRLEDELRRLNAVLRPRTGGMVAPRALQEEFQQALEAGGDVRLTAMGFTGETFALPVKTILQRLSRNPLRRVHLRVLVPDFSKEIEVPGQVDAEDKASDAPEFREHLRRMVVEHERSLKSHIGRMAAAEQGMLTVEFRVLHMSPSLKLYFINSDVVYEGIYDKLDRRPAPEAAPGPAGPAIGTRLLDLIGYDSLLARWSLDGGDQARKIVVRRREHFETLWQAARELTPGTRLPSRPDAA